MQRRFKDYNPNQPMLLPPDLKDWLSENHLALFISDVVEDLDLLKLYQSYQSKNNWGAPAVDPRLMLKLLIYGYCAGVRSSRKLEKACHEQVPFRVISCDQRPDHDTIANFRVRHQSALPDLFLQVLVLCQKAGLVKMAHVSLDGTKVKANAKKSKSRTYEQLQKSEAELAKEIKEILSEAQDIDDEEDRRYGKGKRGDELPEHLRDKKKRRALIKELLEKMNAEAKERKSKLESEKEEKKQEDFEWMDENGFKFERRSPSIPKTSDPGQIIKSRRNPTDYDSRIMKEHQSGGHIQAYNCQAAVDAAWQIIVAADVYSQPTDKQLLRPMLQKVMTNTSKTPDFLTADNGYYSERDIVAMEKLGIDPYIPPTKDSLGKRIIRTGKNGRKLTITAYMKEKLATKTGKAIYSKRKMIAEPVFGQIKAGRNFRYFLLRGLEKVKLEWNLIAIAHNLGKLHRATCFPA